MKKMLSVNLAGILFHINEDAFEMLKSYLEAVEKQFPVNEKNEIIQEIETRIAELFSEKISSRKQVINLQDVEEVIGTLGEPEEYGTTEEKNTKKEDQNMAHNKRLYRDPENKVLGGVCGGLGWYFNADPVLFRIVFIVIFLVFGTGLLVYLILWLITPQASSITQKMEMKGQSFTFSDFKKKARSEYENMKKNFKTKKND
ncbi:MAG: PspC domain-containing protein [Bacteroidales bacterium]|nr:PspC domain-containing protein [Bacteroidales bacterium]